MIWRNIPKVERHVHLEGALTLKWTLKKANTLPGHPWHGKSEQALLEDLNTSDFQEFLENFKNGFRLIRTRKDYQEVTEGLLNQLSEQGVSGADILYSPGVAVQILGVSPGDIHGGIRDALRHFPDIQVQFILDTVLNLGTDFMDRSLEMILKEKPDFVRGFSVGGGLRDLDMKPFLFLFERARRNGLFCVAHCGEVDGPDNIELLIRETDVRRIAHAVRIVENEKVLKLLEKRKIGIDVSLTSNLRTGVVANLDEHPLKVFAARGIDFSLNTDDPFYFQTDLEREYRLAERLIGKEKILESIRRNLASFQRTYINNNF
jgi:adenosine deaminase